VSVLLLRDRSVCPTQYLEILDKCSIFEVLRAIFFCLVSIVLPNNMTNKRKRYISFAMVVVAFSAAFSIGTFENVAMSLARAVFLLVTIACFISAVYYKRPERIRF
jgi:O-antigen ligase